MYLDFRVEKVDNGFIVAVQRDRPDWGDKTHTRHVFHTWDDVTEFISSLNDKFIN